MTRSDSAAKKTKSPQGSKKPTESKTKKLFDVQFYHAWCKQCGLCIAFCPRKIIQEGKNNKPEITDADRCTGCRFCELHCPDFAITVDVRVPRRRKTDE